MEPLSDAPYTVVSDPRGKVNASNESRPVWENMSKDPLKIQVKSIRLNQEPSELLDLEIQFNWICNQDQHNHLYKITRMEIRFHNNLHNFDWNYTYEVLCKCVQAPCDGRGYFNFKEHLYIGFSKPRYGQVIKAIGRYFSTCCLLKSEYVYFYIRRRYPCARENLIRQNINFQSLLKEIATDINLLVGDESLPAHQLVLSHSSDVFKAMFSSMMLEKSTSVVKIEDFSKEVIAEMLDFLYTGTIRRVDMRYELLKVAHKYQLHSLFNRCKEYIIFNSSCENVVETLEIADLFDIKALKGLALKFINKHKAEMSNEPSYHDYLCRTMTLDNVVKILLLATEYDIESVTTKAFDFISENFCKLKGNEHFSNLFESNPSLMREIFEHHCDKQVAKCTSQ